MQKTLLIVAGVALLVIILLGILVSFLFRQKGPVTLTYWGLWEDPNVYSQVIADYQRQHPNITIKYLKQSQLNYRDRLTAALSATGGGPDIARIHNSWLPMFASLLSPAPTSVSLAAFYPVVSSNLVSGGKVYGVPLGIDVLVMFVNDTLLRAGGVNVPVTWDGADGFLNAANKLTVRDTNGRIRTAGAALGTASNVDHWQEIVALMMLQSGVDLSNNPSSQAAIDALSYYVSFARGQRDWDETQDNSTLAFASGKVAFYFGPSWRYFDIKALSPNLEFRMMAVPQLAGTSPVNYATYWAEAVAKNSKNTAEAWDFLKFISSKEELTKIYAAQSKLRAFGQPYPRLEMSALLAADQNTNPVMASVPTAKSWYLDSGTFDGDTGINSRIGKYYQDAINSMLRGTDAKTALTTVAQGVNQVLGQYGVVNSVGK